MYEFCVYKILHYLIIIYLFNYIYMYVNFFFNVK